MSCLSWDVLSEDLKVIPVCLQVRLEASGAAAPGVWRPGDDQDQRRRISVQVSLRVLVSVQTPDSSSSNFSLESNKLRHVTQLSQDGNRSKKILYIRAVTVVL